MNLSLSMLRPVPLLAVAVPWPASRVVIVVVVLVRLGLVSVATLRGIRPYVIVASFVVAAIITPPDPGSMLLLAVPLVLLYEVGLLVARFVRVGEGRAESASTA